MQRRTVARTTAGKMSQNEHRGQRSRKHRGHREEGKVKRSGAAKNKDRKNGKSVHEELA